MHKSKTLDLVDDSGEKKPIKFFWKKENELSI
jgi:hypothetical protein